MYHTKITMQTSCLLIRDWKCDGSVFGCEAWVSWEPTLCALLWDAGPSFCELISRHPFQLAPNQVLLVRNLAGDRKAEGGAPPVCPCPDPVGISPGTSAWEARGLGPIGVAGWLRGPVPLSADLPSRRRACPLLLAVLWIFINTEHGGPASSRACCERQWVVSSVVSPSRVLFPFVSLAYLV